MFLENITDDFGFFFDQYAFPNLEITIY